MPEDFNTIMQKYRQRLNKEVGANIATNAPEIRSREYKTFQQELTTQQPTLYENICHYTTQILKTVPEEQRQKFQDAIDTAHLNITPEGAYSFAILVPGIFILFGIMASLIFGQFFFIIITLLVGLMAMFVFMRLPEFLANSWRMKASNSMVLCIFYIVTYMRHTSNLELAIKFASEHLNPPLADDLKKILWDVQTEKFSSIKESVDSYLERWRKYNQEFIESFHLIESSLYEGEERKRQELLDKSLDIMLEGTFEKMLHYAHNLKSPITTLNMLGIILPVLGLVILPLMVSFMGGVKWYHIAAIYNLLLPMIVYYFGKNILSTRPTGYGDSTEKGDDETLVKNKKDARNTAIVIGIFLLTIALSPILSNIIIPGFDHCFGTLTEKNGVTTCNGLQLIGYDDTGGPFGIGAAALSIFFPLSLGLSLGIYYRTISKNTRAKRERSKQTEEEIVTALSQLSHRLGDGIPAELAFSRVATVMQDTESGKFFAKVDEKIRKLGMGVKQAIFDPERGAINDYQSNMLESSMKVLIESVKKGPMIAAQALENVSNYIKKMHAVNERLRDLMAETIGDMKSQIHFLAPTIAGIVIGIASMITTILRHLTTKTQELTADTGNAAAGNSITEMFSGGGIPTYYFQLSVGIYIIQLIYILTTLSNSIENGSDQANEQYELGQNLVKSTLLYSILTLSVMLIFNTIAYNIMTKTVG